MITISSIHKVMYEMARTGSEAKEIHMTRKYFDVLMGDVSKFIPDLTFNENLLLDVDGNPLPIGKLCGLDLFIDNKLPLDSIWITGKTMRVREDTGDE